MGRASRVVTAGFVLSAACSSTAGAHPPADAGPDVAPASSLVNGCRTFVDRRAPEAVRTLYWERGIAVADERCIQIAAGQSVTWGDGNGGPGNFTMHPLLAFNGEDDNPIHALDYTTGTVRFDRPGTYGFLCSTHSDMTGAVLVTAE